MSDTLEFLTAALAGRYAVGREIGRGGMATVYAATDAATGHEVAVKVLHRDLTVALGPVRFKREIEIASALDHPNILPVLDSGEVGGSLFFVMPLVRGESLHARLVRERQLPVDEAVAIVRDVAAGLAYAHERGIVHRDIKPENILLHEGRAVLADFGIARATADANSAQKLTGTGMTLGTPMYMSPEQAAAERELDGRSDQYSLACVLYEVLAGVPPYSAPTAQGLMARHAMESIPSVRIIRDSVPEQVEDALYRALSKNAVDRFPSVAAFGAALGTPDVWEHPTLRRKAPRTQGDRRRAKLRRAIYSAGLTAPMLVAGWAGWRYWVQPPTVAALPADSANTRNVAVLYFADESPGGRLAPIADGLTESLITELSQVDALRVVSKNGVLAYRDADAPADSVGRALKVGTIVRGSVEPVSGGGVQVVVRLVDGATGEGIGRSATFTQPADNVLALRDSLAATVAEFLRARIGTAVRLRESRSATASAPAWTLVQRAERTQKDAEGALGRNHPDSADLLFGRADSLLAAAAQLDARWAEPSAQRAGIAYRVARLAAGDRAAASAAIDRGLASAEDALQRDPQSAAGFEYRGTLRYLRHLMGLVADPRDAADIIERAQKDLETAVRLDRTRASAFSTLSHLYYQKPDVVSAKMAARQAFEADAFLTDMPKVMRRLYTTSLDLEQLDDAAKYCAEGHRRYPDDAKFVSCRLWLMVAGGEPPQPDTAWRVLADAEKLTPKKLWAAEGRQAEILVAGVLARAGRADSARRVLARPSAAGGGDPEHLAVEAYVRTVLGEKDEAVRLLKAYLSVNPEHRDGFAKNPSWMWKGLRDEPAYKDLVGISR